MITKKNKVILGLSGGVDSTAATLLLQEKGYEVTGVFLDTLGQQEELAEEARKVAKQLHIEFFYQDVSTEFDQTIIKGFCDDYMSGRTPNPCIYCNPLVKFHALAKVADQTGAAYLATGHYANVEYEKENNTYYIAKGISSKKDQSYMLYRLQQDILSRLLLPLGNFERKEQVRQLVKNHGIRNAEKKDSQEICFIKEGTYVEFLKGRGYVSDEGPFVNTEDQVIGTHKGLIHYTVGQRKGLGATFGKPVFVKEIRPNENKVILSDHHALFESIVLAKDPFFAVSEGDERLLPLPYHESDLDAKIRYAASPSKARLTQEEDLSLRIAFTTPQRAPAPGQSVVFYQGNRVIGGAIITPSLSNHDDGSNRADRSTIPTG